MNHQKIVYPSSCVFMQRRDIQKNIPIIYFNFQKEHFKSEANQKNMNSNITAYLRDAKKIYKAFSNEYGIIRVEFLEILYKVASYPRNEDIDNIILKSTDVLSKHAEYKRESTIINAIRDKMVRNESLQMFTTALIKAYPIIMQ